MDQMPLAATAAMAATTADGSDSVVVVVQGEEPRYQCSICMEEDDRSNMIQACTEECQPSLSLTLDRR
jgi:hypothetical protein